MLKEKALEDERLKLAQIIETLNKLKEALKDLENKLLSLREDSKKYLGETFNPIIIANYSSYISKIENDILIQTNKIKSVEIDFLNQKDNVKKAYIEVKTLDKLKEKQLERYKKEVLDEEIKFIDDIVCAKRA